MSSLSPPAITPYAIDPAAVRVVLFGMPDAGKSSLLGALSQAAHTQVKVLTGHLTDLTNGLEELRHLVYEDHPRETLGEIVPYPIQFVPTGRGAGPGWPAVLYDCDGRVANDILTHAKSLDVPPKAGTLADAVLTADALILAVDAAAPAKQVEDDFREFLRFLRLLEAHREKEHAVGGLPVFLTLTKCDLLADGAVSRAEWETRIAVKKADVGNRFREFIEAEGMKDSELLTFGSVVLDVRATAVHKPRLFDAPAEPREPFGVAELFHEAMEDGRAFRERTTRSGRRLVWTVAGTGGFLAAMLIAGTVFMFAPPDQGTTAGLAGRVEMIRAAEGPTPAARLAGPALDRRLRELADVETDPDFGTLPNALKEYVRVRTDEGRAYVAFRDELAALPPLSKARSLAEVGQIESRLQKLAVPEAYRGEWPKTDAVTLREKQLTKEIPALRASVASLAAYYHSMKNRGNALLVEAPEVNADWERRFRALVESAEKNRPFPITDPVHGVAYAYDDVTVAEADWLKSLNRLTFLRDLAAALGLVGDAITSKAPLAPAETPTDAGVVEFAARRWKDLKTEYPNYSKWSLLGLPDAVLPEVRNRLKRTLEHSRRDGQRLVLERLKSLNPTGPEDPADWPRVADYLHTPGLTEWREFMAFQARLDDPAAADPVEATAAFLRQPAVELDIRELKLRIPDNLGDGLIRPAGDLSITHRHGEKGEIARLVLKLRGDPLREKQTVIYTFAANASAKISFHPGDEFFADLAVRQGDREMKFTWSSTRTASYKFERLAREPRLHEPAQKSVDGIVAEGVTTTVSEGKFPSVPPLIPLVRFNNP